MSDIYWLWNFLVAFWSVTVVGCSNPANWEHCFPVNEWFVPWVHDAIHMAEEGAYHSEKQALKKSPK